MPHKMKVDGAGGTSGISEIEVPDYPSNSNASKKQKLRPVAEAKQKSPSKQQEIADIFTGSIKDARADIWNNQIVPGVMDMCANALYTIVDYIFYRGERHRGYGSSRDSGIARRRTDYAGASRSRAKTGNDDYYNDGRSSTGRPRWNEVVVQGNRQDAQRVWDTLAEKLDDNGQISVGDLFSAVGWQTTYTDFNAGWTTLDGCTFTSTREGWWFDMTKPKVLD